MNIIKYLTVTVFVSCLGSFAQTSPTLYKNADQVAMKQWVDSVFDSMTSDERLGQLFMVVVNPQSNYHDKTVKYINEQHVGGILFSKGNINDEAASINLYQKISRIPLFIAFDGEWGLAMRMEDAPLFPRNMTMGAIQDNEWIRLYGEEVGRELNHLGVHINFAPDLDVNSNPNNPVIGTRSFGEKQQSVAEKGIIYSQGLESRKIIAVGKHFPGHGDTSDDSHKSLPLISHNKSRLDEVELYPFINYVKNGFSGIMTAHLSVPALDSVSGLPSSLSPGIVSELLQKEIGFQGLVFTDALAMKGATGGQLNNCVQALLAGNDVLLKPENIVSDYEAVKKALDEGILEWKTIEEKCLKILSYKYIVGLNNYKPLRINDLKSIINSNHADWLARKMNEEAITLLKNDNNSIPLNRLSKMKTAVLLIGEKASPPFMETLNLYGKFDFFNIEENASEKSVSGIFDKLKKYDRIICGIHSVKSNNYKELQALCSQKEVHLCFFVSPYILSKYKQSVTLAKSVSLAYENTKYAQKAAAEVIMGGLPAKGKLPVTIADLYEYGTGISTSKVRLSCHRPEEVGMNENTLRKINKIVKEGIETQAFPGCQVLVAKNGVVVYNQSFGYFDYAGTHPVQNTDIYDLASVTKAIATLPAVMKLYDDNKINLNDYLSKHIPELKDTDKSTITVRDALFHQSGLPSFLPFYQLLIDTASYQGNLFSRKRDLTYRIQYDKNTFARTDFEFRPELVSQTPKDGIKIQMAENVYVADSINKMVLKEIAGCKMKNSGKYLYSDLNFILLKEMVENVSKQKLNILLEKDFFAGLGSNYTTFLPLQKINKKNIAPTENDLFLRNQILIGYPHDETAAVLGGVSGNAGLFSNVNDLAKILQMFLNNGMYGGERFLSEATVKLFTQTKNPSSHRALGFDKPDKTNQNSKLTGKMTPASAYGHTGFTGTCFWVDPDNQLIYIFLSNRVYPSRTHTNLIELNIRSRIQDVIYEAIQ
ncbi:MAG: serine hydrolase [Dysgonamonadaceae bacterium]|nr:serine hydrolase [Dysgonamonadaceae bacterium]